MINIKISFNRIYIYIYILASRWPVDRRSTRYSYINQIETSPYLYILSSAAKRSFPNTLSPTLTHTYTPTHTHIHTHTLYVYFTYTYYYISIRWLDVSLHLRFIRCMLFSCIISYVYMFRKEIFIKYKKKRNILKHKKRYKIAFCSFDFFHSVNSSTNIKNVCSRIPWFL